MPAPATCLVSGVLYGAGAALLTSVKLVIERTGPLIGVDGEVVSPTFGAAAGRAEVTTHATTAAFSVTLVPGPYRARYQTPDGATAWCNFAVPDGQSTADFADLIGTQPAYTPTLVQQAEDARDAAQVAATNSGNSATAAAGYASAAGAASGVLVRDSAAALRADTVLTYTAGQPGTVTAGMVVTTKDGFAFTVLSSGGVAETTNANGVKFSVATGRNCPIPFGAAGDGITNDKTAIDLLNVVNTTVDLRGRDYAYTGAFTPAARFINGRIISSTEGTYDYSVADIVNARTMTVGPSGTMTSMIAWHKWINSGVRITGSLTVTVTGTHTVAGLVLANQDSHKITIIGAAMAGAMPTKADMVGTRATDEATILARFNAVLDVGGSGDNTSGGWRVPNGLFTLENIAILSNTRYSITAGFEESHYSSIGTRRFGLANVAFVGGVWGLLAINCQVRIRASTATFWAYQNTGSQPGGPMDLLGSHARLEGAYRVYSAGQSSKYALHAEAGSQVFANNQMDVVGPFLHGVHAVNSMVECDGLVTDGVSQPLTAQPGGSFIKCNNPSFSNGNVANTNTLIGAGQNGFGNNNTSGGMIHCGAGSTISGNDGTATNMIGGYLFHSISGKIVWGTTAIDASDCRFTAAAARFYGGDTSYLAINVASPKSGSLDQVLALAQGKCRIGTNSGVTFSPAINTVSNGNLLSNTG